MALTSAATFDAHTEFGHSGYPQANVAGVYYCHSYGDTAHEHDSQPTRVATGYFRSTRVAPTIHLAV